MTAAAPELIECPDCGGYGTVACCYAWEVEGVGGPRGCRCAHPGMQPCDACCGTGLPRRIAGAGWLAVLALGWLYLLAHVAVACWRALP